MVCYCLVAKSCPTLCNSKDGSPPGSSVCGISQARIQEWVAISSSRRSSRPRNWTCISCIGRRIFYHWATWEAQRLNRYTYMENGMFIWNTNLSGHTVFLFTIAIPWWWGTAGKVWKYLPLSQLGWSLLPASSGRRPVKAPKYPTRHIPPQQRITQPTCQQCRNGETTL